MIISDLIQRTKLPQSVSLAEVVNKSIESSLIEEGEKPKVLGVKRAPFYVLVGAHMPAVLTELFFINHEEDGLKLGEGEFREILAHGLSRGIVKFLSKSSQ